MKIALLLTGQLRTVDLVKYLHMHSLINKYDTDVFLSIDLNNTMQNENQNFKLETPIEKSKSVIDFFKPVDYFVLDNFNNYFDKYYESVKDVIKIDIRRFKILFAQYYIVHNAYLLLKKHINNTNTKYDLVVRLRFDHFLCTSEFEPIFKKLELRNNGDVAYNDNNISIVKEELKQYTIPLDAVSDNEIYVLGYGTYTHFNYVNDTFFYHNSNLIDTLLTFYTRLSEFLDISVNKEVLNEDLKSNQI